MTTINRLSLLLVTIVVGTLVTIGETSGNRKEDFLFDPVFIDQINQDENMTLLETALENLHRSLSKHTQTEIAVQEIIRRKLVLRLGQLIEDDRYNDGIKEEAADILRFACWKHCDHVFKLNISELLIKQLDKNSISFATKWKILLTLASTAKISAEARDTLIEQGIIGSITRLLEHPNRRKIVFGVAQLASEMASIEDLDSETANSLVSVLKTILTTHGNLDFAHTTKLALQGVKYLIKQRSMAEFYDEDLVKQLKKFTGTLWFAEPSSKVLEELAGRRPGGQVEGHESDGHGQRGLWSRLTGYMQKVQNSMSIRESIMSYLESL